MGSKFLDYFPEIAARMLKLFPKDTTFYATDLEMLTFRDEAVDIPLAKAGKRFLGTGPAATCIRTGEVSTMELDESYYGVPIKVVCSPVFDDDDPDKIIGAYGVCTLRDNAFGLRRLANTYQKGLNEIKDNIEQIADGTTLNKLSERRFNQLVTGIHQMEKETTNSLDNIDSNFKKINTIGFNISKEADRQGDSAREFKVFAEQLKNLSINGEETITNIKELIKKIEKKTDMIVQSSDITLIDSEEQEAAARHVTDTLKELTNALKELQRIAHEI